MTNTKIPDEAAHALEIIEELFGRKVVGVYLYGSAVTGGLQKNSDTDLLAIIDHGLSEATRKSLADKLMNVSGRVGNDDSVRSLEVTVLNYNEIVPWKYPPIKEFIYGEWLRGKYEQGHIPEPDTDPDLAIILYQVRNSSIALLGHAASDLLDPVPMADIRRAMEDCLPKLIKSLKGDERNVILTLARMWVTAATGRILPKDAAAKWAMNRLSREKAVLLDMAGKAYRGEYADKWDDLESELASLVDQLKNVIEYCLDNRA